MRARAASLVLVLAAVIVGLAPAARAAGGSDKEARALFQRAEKSFNLGKFPEALADYQAAYEAKPLSGFLFNIAQCYRNMGNYERARFFYRRYLALEPRSTNRSLVEDLIAEMTRLVDKQAAEHPAAAPAATAPPPEEKPAGAATPVLIPSAPPPGPSLARPEPPAAALVSAPAAEPQPEHPPAYRRWWFWTAVGAVVAGGVVAAVLLTRDNGPQGSLQPIDGR